MGVNYMNHTLSIQEVVQLAEITPNEADVTISNSSSPSCADM